MINLEKYSSCLATLMVLCFPLFAQDDDYDYVVPDSLREIEKRNTVRLPIKPKVENEFFFTPSYADDIDQNLDYDYNADPELNPNKKDYKRTNVGLELGSSVASDFNGNSAISTYIAPHVRHQINDEFAVSGGLIVSQSYFNGWTNYSIDGTPQTMPSSMTSTTAYARLDYRVNDKMLIYGSVYKNLATYPSSFGGQNNQLDGYGYSLGMEYKVSEKSFLQIQINRSQGYNPLMQNSRSFGMGGRPFNSFP